MTPEQLDAHLDRILKASGSGLKNYSMQKTKDDMRGALRAAIIAGVAPVRKALSDLVGVDGGPDLDHMAALITASEAAQAEKAILLSAISVLQKTSTWAL